MKQTNTQPTVYTAAADGNSLYIWGGGGPADPQVHWCQRAGAEGRVGARKQDYNELFRQEMALHETKYLSVYIQISTALPI